MANMIPIQTVIIGAAGASSIDFVNIPQNYTDLLLKVSLRLDSNPQGSSWTSINYSINGSSSNLSYRLLYGTGTGTGSQTGTTEIIWIDASSATINTFGNAELYFPNYTSNNNKSISADFVNEHNGSQAIAGLIASLWSNTSPINRITFTPPSGNFVQYSSATLYGIRKY